MEFGRLCKVISELLSLSNRKNICSLPQNSYNVSIVAAANSTKDGIVTDPCTPKGYNLYKNAQKDSSGFLAEESTLTASLQAAGNFTECRSATYAMLQEGNGKIIIGIAESHSLYRFSSSLMVVLCSEKCPYKHCSIGSTFTPDLQGSFLATSNFYYTSEVLYNLMIYWSKML